MVQFFPLRSIDVIIAEDDVFSGDVVATTQIGNKFRK